MNIYDFDLTNHNLIEFTLTTICIFFTSFLGLDFVIHNFDLTMIILIVIINICFFSFPGGYWQETQKKSFRNLIEK